MTRRTNRGANGDNGHHWIRDEKRARIYARDGWRCVWCGVNVKPGPTRDRFPATLDHVIGRSEGGTNEANNLVTACLGCNSKRRDLGMVQFAFVLSQAAPCVDAAVWKVLARIARAIALPLPEQGPRWCAGFVDFLHRETKPARGE